jgi:hypothetical protein
MQSLQGAVARLKAELVLCELDYTARLQHSAKVADVMIPPRRVYAARHAA